MRSTWCLCGDGSSLACEAVLSVNLARLSKNACVFNKTSIVSFNQA